MSLTRNALYLIQEYAASTPEVDGETILDELMISHRQNVAFAASHLASMTRFGRDDGGLQAGATVKEILVNFAGDNPIKQWLLGQITATTPGYLMDTKVPHRECGLSAEAWMRNVILDLKEKRVIAQDKMNPSTTNQVMAISKSP